MEKIGKYLEALGYFLLIFFKFFKNYLGYLKIKEAVDTLGSGNGLFLLQCETFWMVLVCLGQEWYCKGTPLFSMVSYLKGFL